MDNNTYLDRSRECLSDGRILDCIEILKENVHDDEILNQILQLEVRHNTLKRRVINGTISQSDALLEENRISNPLLMIMTNLARERKFKKPVIKQKKYLDIKSIIIGLLALSLLVIGGYFIKNQFPAGPDEPVRDLCENIQCQNNGICNNGICECPDGYSGVYCQIKDNNSQPPVQPDAKPDLRITAFNMRPEPPTQGEKVFIQAVVKNSGGGNSGNFKVQWWAGVNFPAPAFEQAFTGLGAGEERSFSFQYDGYRSWYGRITSKLEVDVDNSVRESDETNNVFTKSYAVKKTPSGSSSSGGNSSSNMPDLKITAFQMRPEVPIKGEKVYMQAIVKNMGRGDSGSFKIKWWAGVNFPEPAFQKAFNGLSAGEQKVFSFQYEGYPSWYGTITSKLEVDTGNSVRESNENNNVLKKSYAVKRQ